MKKHLKIIIIIAIIIIGIMIKEVYGYFFNYVIASGETEITTGNTTVSLEQAINNEVITLKPKNSGKYAGYMRIKIFTPSSVKLELQPNEKWEQRENGYIYCKDIISVGQDVPELKFKLNVDTDTLQEFNMTVVNEMTETLYKEDGTPYADWNKTLSITN